MKLLKSAASQFEKILDRVLCVLGAVVFSQLPEFMQQYLQRLGGHLDEARRILGQFQQTAALDAVNTLTQRVADLGGAEEALRTASTLKRPLVFFAHLDPEIARATLEVYRPAVPTTVEGLIYSGIGVIVALGLYHGGIKAPVAALLRRRAKKAQPLETPTCRG